MAGDVFISVSKDKSVGLFSLDNMNWYHRFSLLFCFALQNNADARHRCTHSIHVFGGHPAQIRDIGWRAEQDYIIVQCEDGSVSVWEVRQTNPSCS